MSGADRVQGLLADEMRIGFDRAFSVPPVEREQNVEALLAVRIGNAPHALRVAEIAGFAAARKIVPLPSPIAGMLGLAGLRGTVVPVFSLAAWVGYGRAEEPPRWFVLCGDTDPIALAFAEFDGYLELSRSDLTDATESSRAHVRQLVRARGEVRGIVDVASVVRAIQDKVAAARAIKER